MRKLHLEKCMRIINDIVSFCHAEGAEEFQIYYTHSVSDSVTEMTVSCPMASLQNEIADELTEKLNLPRSREVEQNYWELSGESEMSGDLTLVGMMIDKAEVGCIDDVLHIHVTRED